LNQTLIPGNDDLDVMVNLESNQLPDFIKAFCTNNPEEPRLWKMDYIDFWCEPWTDLKEGLMKRDFTINSLTSDENGNVFDELGVIDDLNGPYLRLLGNPDERFPADPSLMMRLIRIASAEQKLIAREDIFAIQRHCMQIKCLPLGIYLKNIEYLFFSRFSVYNLVFSLNANVFHGLIPGLSPSYPMLLQQKHPMLFGFWQWHLSKIDDVSADVRHYKVLALFLLLNVLECNERKPNGDVNIEKVIEGFASNFNYKSPEVEKRRMCKALESLICGHSQGSMEHGDDPSGLYQQYLAYSASREQVSLNSFQPPQQIYYLPGYQTRIKSQQPVQPLPKRGYSPTQIKRR
jgi:hypothetical protein